MGLTALEFRSKILDFMGEAPLARCSVDLPARVKWISSDTFVLIESERPNDTSPPRVYISKVKSIKGNKVTIYDFWTGWDLVYQTMRLYTLL